MNTSVKNIQDRINKACNSVGRNTDSVSLIVVSKKKPVSAIKEVIKSGVHTFGENYIQEAIKKIDEIGNAKILWHYIGHLQSKKSKYAVKYFDMIHSVDSLKLAKELNKQALKINKIQKILIQINIGHEETKSGIDPSETIHLAEQLSPLKNISVQGLMAMPPYYNEPEKVRPLFKSVKVISDDIKKRKIDHIFMNELSMGMTGDFEVAIEEGATMIRIGTAIFGSRI